MDRLSRLSGSLMELLLFRCVMMGFAIPEAAFPIHSGRVAVFVVP